LQGSELHPRMPCEIPSAIFHSIGAGELVADRLGNNIRLCNISSDDVERHVCCVDEFDVRDTFGKHVILLCECDVLLVVDIHSRPVQAIDHLARSLKLRPEALAGAAHLGVKFDDPHVLITGNDAVPRISIDINRIMVIMEVVVAMLVNI